MISRVAAGLCLALAGMPAWAHHSFAAEFDEKKVIKLEGTVTQMEWVNPHTWIHLAVKNADGSVTNWMIEGNTPNSLLRAGFTKHSLEPGTEVVVLGYQARSGENRASGSSIAFKDGRKLSLGSSADANKPLLDWVSQDENIWRKAAKGESK